MNLLKALLILVLTVLFSGKDTYGQYQNIWFRGTLSKPLNSKIKTDVELQHRRQSGYGNRDVLDQNLMYTFRSWVHYRLNHDVRFSVSPFAYFYHYKIIQKQADEHAKPTREIRFSAAVDLQHKLFNKVFLLDRTAVEYRTFSESQKKVTRLRAKIGIRYDLNEKFKIALFDEHFLNTGGVTAHHHFDHERQGINVECIPSAQLKVDVGYVHIKRLPLSGNSMLSENNLFLHLTYNLPVISKHSNSSSQNIH